jgi:hypothetical protein
MRRQREDAIQVATDMQRGRARVLVVWSDGPPLEAAVERHLFEPFFSSESRSSGLGLYICRELCGAMARASRYRRAPWRRAGSPRRQRVFRGFPHGHPHCRHCRVCENGGVTVPAAGSPAQVLVVDDEPDLRTLYELTLLREGYQVDSAASWPMPGSTCRKGASTR